MTATNDGIINLKGRIEGGKLVALLDHEGKDIGAPVTSKENEVTGGIGILVGDIVADGFVSATGLNVGIPAFNLPGFSYAGGSVDALPSLPEQFVGVNIHSKRAHCLRRLGDHGFIPLARIVTNSNSVTTLEQIDPVMPMTRLPKTLAKIKNGEQIKVGIMGSSLLTSAQTSWRHTCMALLPNNSNLGYSVINYTYTEYVPSGSKDFQSFTGFSGSYSGYTVLVSGGPNGGPCLEWAGTGTLYTDITADNGTFVASIDVTVVSGTPTIGLQLSDRYAGNVIGFSSDTALVYSTHAVSGVTGGVNAGARVFIQVSGGTVRINNFSVRRAAEAMPIIGNAASNGMRAAYCFTLAAGESSKLPAVNFLANDKAAEISLDTAPLWNTAYPNAYQKASLLDCDLVIYGGLANDGHNRDLFHEPTFHALRRAGVEVLVCTDNAQSPTSGDPAAQLLFVDGPRLMRIAESLGCAVADTAAYVAEAYMRGISVYQDTIHMNSNSLVSGVSAKYPSSGMECWAESISGVLSVNSPRSSVQNDLPIFKARDPQQPGAAKIIWAQDIKVTAGTPTLTSNAAGPTIQNNVPSLYGIPSGSARLIMATGDAVCVAHPMMIGLHLLCQGNNFVAQIKQGGAVVATFTVSGQAPTVCQYEVITPAQLTGGVGKNNSVEIVVTSGQCWLWGAVVMTPLYKDITKDLYYRGTWAEEASGVTGVLHKYSDTANDSVLAMSSDCRSIVIGTNEGTQGGVAIPTYDGVVQADQSLVGSSNIRYRWASFGALGKHAMTYKLKTAGASPVAGNRSLGVVQAFAVLDR